MNVRNIFLILCFFTFATSNAQETKNNSKYSLGGNIGLSFSGDVNIISFSPRLNYAATELFHLGAGIGYTYLKDSRFTPNLTQNIYTASMYAKYFLVPGFFIHAEPGLISYKKIQGSSSSYTTTKEFSPTLNVGAGIQREIGPGIHFQLQFLYDLLWKKENSYNSEAYSFSGGFLFSI